MGCIYSISGLFPSLASPSAVLKYSGILKLIGELVYFTGNSLTAATRRFFLGDQNMCYSGTCEFFLMCWVSGGLIEEGCGGFLYACCNRPGRAAHYPANFGHPNFRNSPRGLVPMDHGPVRNDPRTYYVTSGNLFYGISTLPDALSY